MKKILLILAIFTTLTFAGEIDERITDIYYGNGVWNDIESAKNGRNQLSRKILQDIYSGNIAEFKKNHFTQRDNPDDNVNIVLLQYNWTGISPSSGPYDLDVYFGKFWDLVEMFDQLQKEGQLPNFTFFSWLQNSQSSPLQEWFSKYLISIDGANVRIMRDRYMSISFSKSHRVFLVSHSQGNAFANRIHDAISPTEYRNYFANLQVASPVSSIHAKNGSYVTLIGDKIINPIPGSMKGNANLNPEDDKILDANHEFVSEYLRQVDPLTKIIKNLKLHINSLKNIPSQWKPKQTKSCGTTYCKDKSIAVTHIYDPIHMDKHLGNAPVYPFNTTKGKLFKVDAKYVLAGLGAETIVDNPRDGVCYEITETAEHIDGEKKDTNSSSNGNTFTVTEGIIETTIAWNYELDIDMDLDMSGPNVHHDVKDIPDAGLEHAYVKDHFDVNPGDIFELRATGEKSANSQLDEECLDTEPVSIFAIVKTPSGSRFKQYQAQNFSELNLEKFAEIEVEETISPKWICPALGGASGWHNLYNTTTNSFECIQCSAPYSVVWNDSSKSYFCNKPVVNQVYGEYTSYATSATPQRTYQDTCSDDEKKSTCGCVPCEYIVRGMENAVEFGPIAGANVKIVSAKNYGDANASVIYSGVTTSNTDILKAGLIELSSSDKAKFDDENYYVIFARGGEDVDRDDDLVRDDIPTPNEGTIHAIIKGSDLKLLSFRLNVLTEAVFQVSGGVLGSNYDAVALENKLDEAAKKLIKEKLYPTDSDMSIVYRDVLLWAPGVDKRVLYKPYNIFVEPIVEKTYSDSPRFDESYTLIYEPFISNAPLLSPISLEIPQGLPNNTAVAKVVVSNDKSFVDVEIKGSYSDYFSMSSDGTLSIVKREAIHTGNRYLFKMRAIDSSGNTGGWVGLNIQVGNGLMLHNPDATVPQMVSIETFDIVENSIEGTVVANAIFEDSNQTIVEYKLAGDDKNSFSVDSNGVITVSANANIDYEASKLHSFSIIAKNDAGNESYPILVSINILNEIDTPLYPLVFFKHVEENTALGTELGKLDLLRSGLSPIDKFEILSPNIPFEISKDGVVSISNYLDYEQTKSYRFIAIAKSQYGDSNKIECQIVIDNQDPEIGIPSLKDLTIRVDESVLPNTKI